MCVCVIVMVHDHECTKKAREMPALSIEGVIVVNTQRTRLYSLSPCKKHPHFSNHPTSKTLIAPLNLLVLPPTLPNPTNHVLHHPPPPPFPIHPHPPPHILHQPQTPRYRLSDPFLIKPSTTTPQLTPTAPRRNRSPNPRPRPPHPTTTTDLSHRPPPAAAAATTPFNPAIPHPNPFIPPRLQLNGANASVLNPGSEPHAHNRIHLIHVFPQRLRRDALIHATTNTVSQSVLSPTPHPPQKKPPSK